MKPMIIMLLASVVCACGTGGKKNEGNWKPLTVDIMSRLFKYWEEHPVSSDASDGMKKLRQACTNEEDNPVIIVCNYE